MTGYITYDVINGVCVLANSSTNSSYSASPQAQAVSSTLNSPSNSPPNSPSNSSIGSSTYNPAEWVNGQAHVPGQPYIPTSPSYTPSAPIILSNIRAVKVTKSFRPLPKPAKNPETSAVPSSYGQPWVRLLRPEDVRRVQKPSSKTASVVLRHVFCLTFRL